MLKNYNNTYIGIPLILRRQRSFLLRKFPELIKYQRKYDPLHILEAIFYLLRSGCQWRLLPTNYPHWKSVYNKWRYWNAKGIFKRIHSCLVGIARQKAGRKEGLDNYRRLARNYERVCENATNMTITAEIYRLLRFI